MTWLRSFRHALFPPGPRGERRAVDRMPTPVCPSCHTRDNVRNRSRSDYAVYFECKRCGEPIILNKPKGSGRI
jgi:predicted RNA-binding Zn-ribbon protein involved in translation (DUF1610 family)